MARSVPPITADQPHNGPVAANRRERHSKKPPRVDGRAVTTKTTYGTKSTYIFYTCIRCGDLHRVNEYGLRVTACRQGLVFVVAGGGR